LLFHKKLGTYAEKALRIERLARRVAQDGFGQPEQAAGLAATAARLAKADLTTDMVREFTELQGTIGGIYAREEGQPEEVWKTIYFHYLPVGVEADTAPSRAQLGRAAATWAAVSLADRLDTLVGLFAAGEKPTGSRDPFGLRRAAQATVKVLSDLGATAGVSRGLGVKELVAWAFEPYLAVLQPQADWQRLLFDFLVERQSHLLERRGYRYDEIRAVLPEHAEELRPAATLRRVEALSKARQQPAFEALAVLFKRVKNITRDFTAEDGPVSFASLKDALREPAEQALLAELERLSPKIELAVEQDQHLAGMNHLAQLHGAVDRFFVDVLVMADDRRLRTARLTLLKTLKDMVLKAAGDISEIAPEQA